jgi:long-chain acyl-CoA synthetase
MDKIWLKSYPPGVPAEIDPDQYGSLVQLLEESFQKYAANNAFVCMDKFLTYANWTACRSAWRPGCKAAAWPRARAWR